MPSFYHNGIVAVRLSGTPFHLAAVNAAAEIRFILYGDQSVELPADR